MGKASECRNGGPGPAIQHRGTQLNSRVCSRPWTVPWFKALHSASISIHFLALVHSQVHIALPPGLEVPSQSLSSLSSASWQYRCSQPIEPPLCPQQSQVNPPGHNQRYSSVSNSDVEHSQGSKHADIRQWWEYRLSSMSPKSDNAENWSACDKRRGVSGTLAGL